MVTVKDDQQRLAKILGEVLMEAPQAPEDWECCGSECGESCIQTLYLNEQAAYQAQQARLQQLAQQLQNQADESND